ncbi:MAG: hypothetical protein HQL94_09175 [Magnetococcales bacterium]|nr:hypothetical protein [Magnetococcales bacterium]MBF0437664.1 hypothetical protein [Magnetococcales bacterium]
MSITILAAPLNYPMKPAMGPQSGSKDPSSIQAAQKQGGLFDQFLTQAEKDFLAAQMQSMKWRSI